MPVPGVAADLSHMSDLTRRTLGRTGLEVTQLGFGAAERGLPDSADHDARAAGVLHAALDAGVNLIDTAPDYGASEERIGRCVGHRRHEFYLATKCGCNIDGDGNRLQPGHLWTADRLRANIDQSLRRLGTDCVDLLQMHNPSVEDVERGGLIEALEEIRAAGKTRFIGVSSTHPHLAAFVASGAFDVFQIPYSALEREHEGMMQEAADAGAGILVRGGISLGHRADERRQATWEKAGLEELAGGMSRHEFILRFTLSHPACHTTIVGTTSLDHMRSNLDAARSGPLPADLYAEARARLASIGESPLEDQS